MTDDKYDWAIASPQKDKSTDAEYIRADLAIEKALIFSCDKCGDSGEQLYWEEPPYTQFFAKKKPCPCTENPHSIYSIKKGVTE
jgi:hypothetical protein